MHAITQGTLEREIYYMAKYFNKDFDGRSIRECIDELRKLCPQLHTIEELQEFNKGLLRKIKEEYGFLGLRVWFSLNMKSVVFQNEMMGMKYYKMNEEIKNLVNNYRKEQNILLKLDVWVASMELQKMYKKEYGVLNEDFLSDVYSILRTIHLTNYDKTIINKVNQQLLFMMCMVGDKYYTCKDLTDISILKEIYVYVAEEMGDGDVYKGHDMFYDYDGYGNYIINYGL